MKAAVKPAVATLAILFATPALADSGHIAERGGHNHWYVLGALAVALVIGGVTLWRERRAKAVRKAAARKAGEPEA